VKKKLLKYIKGDCTFQEKKDIIQWLDSDPANMKEYISLRRLNDITIWQTNSDILSHGKSKKYFSLWSWNKYYTEIFKIAAVFIFAIFVSRFIFSDLYSGSPTVAMQTINVPAGQRAELTLADGTKVWLNANTKLIFPNQFVGKSRVVKLDGEGFFDVAHNRSIPFIVKTNNKYNVKVWGTKFNIIAYSTNKKFETSLLDGSVEILMSGHKTGRILKPNERIFSKNNKMVISPIKNNDNFLWKEGIINFDNVTFTELINKLELYFDLKIEVRNNQIKQEHYSGKFRTKDGIEHILKVLQLKNKFNYCIDREFNKIIIE